MAAVWVLVLMGISNMRTGGSVPQMTKGSHLHFHPPGQSEVPSALPSSWPIRRKGGNLSLG